MKVLASCQATPARCGRIEAPILADSVPFDQPRAMPAACSLTFTSVAIFARSANLHSAVPGTAQKRLRTAWQIDLSSLVYRAPRRGTQSEYC